MKRTIPFFLSVLLLFLCTVTSCSIEKRVHLPGYHVNWHRFNQKFEPNTKTEKWQSPPADAEVLSLIERPASDSVLPEPESNKVSQSNSFRAFAEDVQSPKPKAAPKSAYLLPEIAKKTLTKKAENGVNPKIKRGPLAITGHKALDWFLEFWIHFLAAICGFLFFPVFLLIIYFLNSDNIFSFDHVEDLKREKKSFANVFHRTFLISLYTSLITIFLGLIILGIVLLILAGYGNYLLIALLVIIVLLLISSLFSSDSLGCLFMGWGK